MKKITLLTLLSFAIFFNSQASDSKYEQVMTDNIVKIYNAQNIEEYQQVINIFERIAQNETEKWEPLYYSAFGYVMISNKSEENSIKDKYLDLALEKVKAGLQLVPSEDELVALEGFIHMMRLTIDPANRGQQYAGLSMQSLNKAITLDKNNPRALYLLGQMEMGTARFFGNDVTDACSKIQKAVLLFSEQINDNPLAPIWGENGAKAAAKNCQSTDN
jgi:tetratricopeptide (TPR) repeat protein